MAEAKKKTTTKKVTASKPKATKAKKPQAKGAKANKEAKAQRQKKFLEAFANTNGIIAPACESIGISRKTFYLWKNEDKDFAELVEEIAERQTDFVEGKLQQKIDEGDTTAIIFYLKTKGRNRGYSERIELTGKDGEDLISKKSDEELEARIKELEKKIKD